MDKNTRNIVKNIKNSIVLEESIPQFFQTMADYYHLYAGVRLSLHYYGFYETFIDQKGEWKEDAKALITETNQLIQKNILEEQNGQALEEAIAKVDEIRNEIMERMTYLTSFTDMFQIYEYILNRMEYSFREDTVSVDDEEFAREILRYIFDTQDNVIINEKIKEIVGQLPIRMTKQKYFDILSQSMNAYLGAEATTFDTFLYLIRTTAMLGRSEGMIDRYPFLTEKFDYFSKLNFKELKKEEFLQATGVLRDVVTFLERETTLYFGLQEIINEIYSMMLCGPYRGLGLTREESQKAFYHIIRRVNEEFEEGANESLPTSFAEDFQSIEGVQEDLIYDMNVLEDGLYEVSTHHKELAQSLELDKLLNVLLRSRDLLSNSLFIEFNQEIDDQIVDEPRLEQEKEKLIQELKELFQEHDRAVTRAIIANTLSKLPVFFKDHKEVMDYVLYSLTHCTDGKEKLASIEIIKQMMMDD